MIFESCDNDLKLWGGYWLTTLKRFISLAPRYEWMVAPTADGCLQYMLSCMYQLLIPVHSSRGSVQQIVSSSAKVKTKLVWFTHVQLASNHAQIEEPTHRHKA